MTNRLTCIYNLIIDGVGVIDVGTDHALIPIHLAQNGYSGKIIAADISRGPLSKALKAASAAGVADRIDFLLSDGLTDCAPEAVDTIVIAGMGGDLICDILDRAEWCISPRYRLILQPMTKAEILRYWLVNNGFSICDELIAKDGGRLYQIICARFGAPQRLADAELYTGKVALVHASPQFEALLERLLKRFTHALTGLQSGAEVAPGREAIYGDILHGLLEMKDNENG